MRFVVAALLVTLSLLGCDSRGAVVEDASVFGLDSTDGSQPDWASATEQGIDVGAPDSSVQGFVCGEKLCKFDEYCLKTVGNTDGGGTCHAEDDGRCPKGCEPHDFLPDSLCAVVDYACQPMPSMCADCSCLKDTCEGFDGPCSDDNNGHQRVICDMIQ